MTTTYRVVAASHSPGSGGTAMRGRSHYPFRVMGGLGIAQVFLGILAICMQMVALCTTEPTSYLAAGIWGGVFFIGSGGVSFFSTKRRNVAWSIAVMVVSIFAILVSLGILAVGSIGLHLTSSFEYETEYPLSWKTLESLLVVIALVEALVALITALMACKGIYIGCQIPKKDSKKKMPVYVYPPSKGHAHNHHQPQPDAGLPAVEMKPLVKTAAYINDLPPAPPPRSSFPMTHTIVMDHEDVEPPPAYSEIRHS